MASRADKLTLALMTTISLGLFAMLVVEFTGGGKRGIAAPGSSAAAPAASDSSAAPANAAPQATPASAPGSGSALLNG